MGFKEWRHLRMLPRVKGKALPMIGWSQVRPYLAGLVIAAAIVAATLTVTRRGGQEVVLTVVPLTPADGGTITVFVGGAVVNPGVYTLAQGARVEDAITSAGGFGPDADPDGINRALRLRDEGQVLVPRKGQPTATPSRPAAGQVAPPTAISAAPTSGRQPTPTVPAGPIDVNSAGTNDLARLPGVGPKLAQDIVDYRNAHGPFKDAADLAKVKGISDRMVAGWAALIVFGP